MSNRQKYVLIVTLAMIFLTLAFPPFQITFQGGVVRNLGYSFILNPPRYSDRNAGSVNIGLLAMQWLGILIIGVSVMLLQKNRN